MDQHVNVYFCKCGKCDAFDVTMEVNTSIPIRLCRWCIDDVFEDYGEEMETIDLLDPETHKY